MKMGFAMAVMVMGAIQTGTQPSNCAPRERRMTAIRHARAINTAEANRPKPSIHAVLIDLICSPAAFPNT